MKKSLSLLLALLLCLGLFPSAAWAGAEEADSTISSADEASAADLTDFTETEPAEDSEPEAYTQEEPTVETDSESYVEDAEVPAESEPEEETESEESVPVPEDLIAQMDAYDSGTRTPQTYTVSSTSGIKMWLFPGDTLIYEPESQVEGYVGFWLPQATDGVGLDGIEGHIKVLQTKSYGEEVTDTTKGNTVIQKIEIIGTQPVFVQGTGGGGMSKSENPTDEAHAYVFYVSNVSYRLADEYMPVEVSYENDIGGENNSSVHFYGDYAPPDKLYAVDCTSNNTEVGTNAEVHLGHPYVEGYHFYRWEAGYSSTDNNYIVQKQGSNSDSYLTWTLSSAQYGNISYGTGTKYCLKATFSASPTITLNACGGTVDGYESRIYEFYNNQSETFELPTPTREGGWRFDGWYAEESYTNRIEHPADADYAALKYENGDSKIYRAWAKWTPLSVDEDDDIDATDITALIKKVLNKEEPVDERGDLNGDGELNLADIIQLLKYLMSVSAE